MTHHTDLRPAEQGSAEQSREAPPTMASTGRDRWTVRRAGVVAGVALLVMVPAAVFAKFVALDAMITPGDGTATAAQIVAREGTFRLGVLAWLLVIVLDVVVAWALVVVFRPVSTALSVLAGVFRLVYTAVLVVAVGQLLRALDLLTGDFPPDVLTPDEVAAQAQLELDAFQHVYDLGLVLFGVHLALLGYLSLRSDFIPNVIGVLLVAAGIGYAFDTAAAVLAVDVPFRVAMFTFLGELLLALWLVGAGRRLRAADTAEVVGVRHAR